MPFLFDFSDPVALESFLAALHILAILTVIVFQSSQAALCRQEWMNEAVVHRMRKLDKIFWTVAIIVVLTGVLRLFLGAKGLQWYTSRPLFHIKMTIVLLMGIFSLMVTFKLRQWKIRLINSDGLPEALPWPEEIARVRFWIMTSAHLLPVAGILAVYWSRGW